MINSRVMVTMQNIKTFMAFEGSLTERHVLNIEPALAASMAASSGPGIFQKLSTACYSFVGQHIHKTSPRSIVYALSKPAILNHAFDIKSFTGDYAISDGKASAQFVKPVSSDVADLEMLFAQSESDVFPVVRAFNFSADSSLQNLNSFFCFNEEVRISYDFTIGQSGKVLQSNINSNRFFGRRNIFNLKKFTGENSKPLISFIDFDGHSFDFTLRSSVQNNGDITYFGSIKPPIIDKFESRLIISNTINSGFKAWKSFLPFLSFNSSKEILKGLMKPYSHILFNLRVKIKRILSFEKGIKVKSIKRNTTKLIGIFAHGKKVIINCFGGFKITKKPDFLFRIWINSVFVYSQFHIINGEYILVYKPYGQMSSGYFPY